MLNRLGVQDMQELQEMLKRIKGGMNSDGKSYYCESLRGQPIKISDKDLDRYDGNITEHVDHINETRTEKINLKYFQYLAVLFTEIFLDNVFNRKDEFLCEINEFLARRNGNRATLPSFSQDDIRKIAYWMATGSGKTLIMHINYLQYEHYTKTPPNNILLITPNEPLSKQHLIELRKSGILAGLFNDRAERTSSIQIFDIHKLAEEPTGKGVSIDVSSFEGNNLVFVDEGHKGFSGTKWKGLRDKISEMGFTFEYSATFNEAIKTNRELAEEYSKGIIMDYSYYYFYHDGFGKDFRVMNLEDAVYDEHKKLVILANLVSFYQQLKVFQTGENDMRDFLFDKPLWIFVGNSVAGRRQSDQAVLSDLQYVISFINEFLGNRPKFSKLIKQLIGGKTPLVGKDGKAAFLNMFGYLKEHMQTGQIYDDILKCVFNTSSGGHVVLCNIRGANGEVGLRASTSANYFALVYVGDAASVRNGLNLQHDFQEDRLSESLFGSINSGSSPINILIGAKKFIEGWDSFRVSTMGLLNTGRTEGPQIIQLFGRGVRIRGYGNSMKRSSALGEHVLEEIPPHIRYLETLNIFGIEANYVETFRKQLEKEGIREIEVIGLNICKSPDISKNNLKTMKLARNAVFSTIVIAGTMDSAIEIDTRPNIQEYESGQDETASSDVAAREFPLRDNLDRLDWDEIYFKLYDFKQSQGLYNLYFNRQTIKDIMEDGNYKIMANQESDIAKPTPGILEKTTLRILQKHLSNFYNVRKRKWITENLEYAALSHDDRNFQDYKIMVDKKETALIKKITELINEMESIYKKDSETLPSIVFDKHLYQPLLAQNSKFTTIPTGLNKGETQFIEDLRKYFHTHRGDKVIKKYKFYILRNQSKSGVGLFADTNDFYPDFIMWAKGKKKEKITFIDPKGLIHGPAENSAKIGVNDTLKRIQKRLGKDNIELASFIVSGSPLAKIKGLDGLSTKSGFEEKHVVFQDDSNYVEKIISSIIKS